MSSTVRRSLLTACFDFVSFLFSYFGHHPYAMQEILMLCFQSYFDSFEFFSSLGVVSDSEDRV